MIVCFPRWRRLTRRCASTTVTVLLANGMARLSRFSEHVDASSAKNTIDDADIHPQGDSPRETAAHRGFDPPML